MTSPPLVSVVMPAYNVAWCITKAIDSVLAQHHSQIELIIVDDGSTDNTAEVLKSYGDRIRVLHQPNSGQSSARNTGIRAARGKYIAFLDADDWWLPEKLQQQVELLEKFPHLGFCSTAAKVVDESGRILNHWNCPGIEGEALETLFQHHAAVAGGCSSVMMRHDLFQQVELFDESLAGFEDPDLWIRLAAVTGYGCIDQPLVRVLRRTGSVSGNLHAMRQAAIRSMHKNRQLLPKNKRGTFWRNCLAGVYADYAMGAYRSGERTAAVRDILHACRLAPLQRGRLCLGLLKDIALRRSL
jgi:glycosyltransferase involved in cell wall biosynthesis